jgi:hypothetical protein
VHCGKASSRPHNRAAATVPRPDVPFSVERGQRAGGPGARSGISSYPARGYADVGLNAFGAIFDPEGMMSIPKRAFQRLGAGAPATGAESTLVFVARPRSGRERPRVSQPHRLTDRF